MALSDKDFGSFKILSCDLWYRKVGPTRFHVLRLEHTEEWGDNAVEQYGRYHVELSEVDLTLVDVHDALASCGYELHAEHGIWVPYSGDTVAEHGSTHFDLVIVECCVGYGAKAPLHQDSGNNLQKLMREARAESRSLDNPEKYEQAMSRPVNAIGSTAREYMQGDIKTPLLRGEARGDKDASLMAKIYRACGGQTLGGEVIDLGPEPKNV